MHRRAKLTRLGSEGGIGSDGGIEPDRASGPDRASEPDRAEGPDRAINLEAGSPTVSESFDLLRRATRQLIESVRPALRDALARLAPAIAPAAMALVYVWFGALKIVGISPAAPLVVALQQRILPAMNASACLVLLGIAEVAIGALFLSARRRNLALLLFAGHMVATLLPLALLPERAWQGPFAPTLEGQYIIKNAVLIALGAVIAVESLAATSGARGDSAATRR